MLQQGNLIRVTNFDHYMHDGTRVQCKAPDGKVFSLMLLTVEDKQHETDKATLEAINEASNAMVRLATKVEEPPELPGEVTTVVARV